MKLRAWWGVLCAAGMVLALVLGRAGAQDGTASPDGAWDAATLKKAISDIGYEPKVLESAPGKEKVEFAIEKGGFTIPVAAEISPSKNYVWLTVRLGDAPKDFDSAGAKLGALLKANAKVQPCQFYITEKGTLMLALPVDNRSLTNPVLRRRVDFLTNTVVEQKGVWQS